MIRLFANANYDYIGLRRIAYVLTGLFIIPGMVMIAVSGLNYSIEFTGGTLVEVAMKKPAAVGDVRAALIQGGVRDPELTNYAATNTFVVRARLGAKATADEREAQQTAQAVSAAIARRFGPVCTPQAPAADCAFRLGRYETVGPKVGSELRAKALIAILLSFAATMVYLAFRFEWRFGVAAVLATAHDILTTLAFIKYMNLEVSLVVVSAILTVVGYSLNDTIIIFDRTRENLHKYKREDLAGLLNRSINETLPRSILTHGTTLATTLALLIFAGEVIRPFACVMAFGIFTGTFSSIYIAAPILLLIEKRWPGKDARGVKARVMPAGAPAASAPPTSGIRVPTSG